MTQEEYNELLSKNTLVYLTKDYKGYNLSKGDIVKPVDTMIEGGQKFVCVRKQYLNTTSNVRFEDIEILKSNNGRLQVIALGSRGNGCSLSSFNEIVTAKVKIGDCTTKYEVESGNCNLKCVWDGHHWYTEMGLLRFIPNDEEEPKAKVDTEEQIPTPLKAVRQATGLSIDMTYTYTPTDTQNEFIGVIEGFMITKKGIFVVDYNGDVIPADKCKKAK